MTAVAMTGAQALKMNENDFQTVVKEMPIKDLMETISGLQKEMAKEQENFNSLSSELQNFKDRNSRQYKQISKDLVASQQRLTSLMNRSMKCFAQQNIHNSGDSTLKRRNSVKGYNTVTVPASAYSNIQRSKSLHAVNDVGTTDLSSSFQSSLPKTHATDSPGSSQQSRNVSHMPIIMKTTANGGLKVSQDSASNTQDRLKLHSKTTDAFGYPTDKTQSLPASSRLSKSGARYPSAIIGSEDLNGTDKECVSSSSSAAGNNSSSISTGLYVKRKTTQQPRVITTTNISSSKFLPLSQPISPPPVSAPTSSTSMLSLNSAASSTITHTTHTPTLTAISSSANDKQSIKFQPVAKQQEYISPLQMAQARKGVSKSQTFLHETDKHEFRGLPSVKLLAQAFGSNTALNTISVSGSSGSTNRFANANKVYRSNSSLNLADPQSSTSTLQFVQKGGSSVQTSQNQQSAVIINGKPQQTQIKHLNRVPHSPAPSNVDVEHEFERTRTRLKSVGRDLTAENTTGSVQSSVPSPSSSIQHNSQTNPVVECEDERVGERNRVGAYVKKKDILPNRAASSTQPSSHSSVTVKSINSPSSLSSSTMAGAVSGTSLPPQKLTASSHNSSVENVKSVSKSNYKTTENSSSADNQTVAVNTTQRQQTAASNSSSKNNTSFVLLSHKEPNYKEPVISTSALRRAKSKEELQEIENNSRTNKGLLLQQIQSRRKDNDTEAAGESNFRAMSTMSRSLPSLLSEDNDAFSKESDGSKSSPIKSSIVLTEKEKNFSADRRSFIDDGIEMEDEEKVPRMNLRDWDPSPLLSELYKVKLADEVVEDISHQFITMEGLMEKLPMNKRKATLLKTWKRRFFKAKDGWLYYYESSNHDQPSESIKLMGGMIHDIGTRVLGIDDGRGRFLMVRCPTEKEYGQWKVALESQTADNTKATYLRPVLRSPKHSTKNVLIIDIGISAIRAGILGQQASLPELFFPSLVAVDKDSEKVVAIGQDALKPDIRHNYRIIQPIRPSIKVDQFNIEVHLMKAIFEKIFNELNVNPAEYWIMMSTPQNLGDQLKKGLMEILVTTLKVKGVCMVQQALLALYSYNATSGIIVDIGHRIEILPIFDGFVIEGGVARCPYGAQKVQQSLTTSLLSNNYKFVSTTEQLLVRYAMEKACYVATDYNLEVEWSKSQPQTSKRFVKFSNFGLPDGAYEGVECDLGRFKSPEGFFNVDLWEMDYPTLQKLIYQAIQTCPMDNRRHVWRAVFLSGGVTLLPGFADRLERELSTLAPSGVPVEVHAAPQRYHAAYIGACAVALMPQFADMAISRDEWKRDSVKAFRKWQAPSS